MVNSAEIFILLVELLLIGTRVFYLYFNIESCDVNIMRHI
jgi:hypothetical protein